MIQSPSENNLLPSEANNQIRQEYYSPMGNFKLLSTSASYGQWCRRLLIQLTGRYPLQSSILWTPARCY